MPEIRVVGNTIEFDGVPVADVRNGLPATFRESFVDHIEYEMPDVEYMLDEEYQRGYDEGYNEGYDNARVEFENERKNEEEQYWSGR